MCSVELFVVVIDCALGLRLQLGGMFDFVLLTLGLWGQCLRPRLMEIAAQMIEFVGFAFILVLGFYTINIKDYVLLDLMILGEYGLVWYRDDLMLIHKFFITVNGLLLANINNFKSNYLWII